MQVAHDGDALDDPFTRELQDETEHAVRRGVLGTHVEDELLDLALFDLDGRKLVPRYPGFLGPAAFGVRDGYDLSAFHDFFAKAE
jgi:hypothetical protein